MEGQIGASAPSSSSRVTSHVVVARARPAAGGDHTRGSVTQGGIIRGQAMMPPTTSGLNFVRFLLLGMIAIGILL